MSTAALDMARRIMGLPAEDRYDVLNAEINRYVEHPAGSRERAIALDFNARLVSALSGHCLAHGVNPPWLPPRNDR